MWFYPLAIVSPQVSSIVVELQVTGLAEHTTWALNQTHPALGLLAEKVDQMRKVVLQDRMALDILTAAQGGTCAVVHTECCVYIADNEKNVIQALSALATEIDGIQRLTGDPYKSGGLICPSPGDGLLPLREE